MIGLLPYYNSPALSGALNEGIEYMYRMQLFTIGQTQVTPGLLLAVLAVILITYLTSRLIRAVIERYFKRHSPPHQKTFKTYVTIVQIIVWAIGLELALHMLGIRLIAFFAASGLFAVGAGLAVKSIVENLLSGSVLHSEKLIRTGDLILVDGRRLFVRHLGVRTIEATTLDGEAVLIPNTIVVNSMVHNLTRKDQLYKIRLNVGVAYESDLTLVRKTLEETVEKWDWRSQERKSSIYLHEFGDSSVNYKVEVWIDDVRQARHRLSDLHETVWQELKDAGISIAFPQLDVHIDRSAQGPAVDPVDNGANVNHEDEQ